MGIKGKKVTTNNFLFWPSFKQFVPYSQQFGKKNKIHQNQDQSDQKPFLAAFFKKVPKCEIFHLFDFNEFYGVKSL